MITRKSFIDSLGEAKDINEHYAFVDSCVKRNELDTLKVLFTQIHEQYPLNPADWAPRAVIQRIVDSVALTDGYDNALAALEFVQLTQGQSHSSNIHLAAVVSKLVATQQPSVIDRLLNTVNDLESNALILHEAVVRGKLHPGSPAAKKSADRLARNDHPLAFLPLTLFDFEDKLLLPNYRIGSTGTSIPFGPLNTLSTEQSVDSKLINHDWAVTETTTRYRTNQISTVVRNWEQKSNGKIEARTFRLRGSTVKAIAPFLPSLGLECHGPSDTGIFRDNQPVKDVFTILFSAASTGGAYNSGEFAAYGRLLAWRSLAGLVGCSEDSTIDEIVRRAVNSKWCLFCSSSEWYYQVAWDIGIACAPPEQNEIAILAATDTD